MIFILLLALGIGLSACDRGPSPGSDEDPGAAGADAPALALYRRELHFVSEETGRPAVTVLAQVRPLRNRALRSIHAWMSPDTSWSVLALDRWEAAPLRQPWRVLPHGPLRLLVGEGEEIEALVFGRTVSSPRLEPGPLVSEWSAGPEARVLLRDAQLRVGGAVSAGLLLDVELGSMATPAGAVGARAVLTDGEGTTIALVMLPDEGLQGLAFTGPQAESLPIERVSRVEGSRPRWRLHAPDGEVVGELTASTEPPERAAGEGDEQPDPVVLPSDPPLRVTGWVRIAAQRREVAGLLRPEGA